MSKMWEEQCWAFRRSPNPPKMAENEVRYEREEASE